MIALLKFLAGWCPTLGLLIATIVSFKSTQKYRVWILAFINHHDPDWKYFQRPTAMGPASNNYKLYDPQKNLTDSIHAEWKMLIRSFWFEQLKYVTAVLVATIALQRGLIFLLNTFSATN